MSTKVAVLGVGASGKSSGEVLSARGNTVRGFAQEGKGPFPFPVVLDADTDVLVDAIIEWDPSYCVASPGIPESSLLIRGLRDAGQTIISEVDLAWDLQESSAHAGRPWLSVTGTNGKTTTVGILSAILTAANMNPAEVGNVGLPIVSQVDSDAQIFVVELSSFQLATSRRFCSHSAICLNIDSDHIDWHGSVDAYVAAKGRIYDRVQDKSFYFRGDKTVQLLAERSRHPVALDTNTSQWDWVPFLSERGCPQGLRDDVIAAVAMARSVGVSETAIVKGLTDFRPQAHRLETIGTHAGVTYVDDSKATNAHAAAAALETLARGSAVWVAGGDAKGQDFHSLVHAIADRLRAVVLIGVDPAPLRRALVELSPSTPIVEIVGNDDANQWMARAVSAARDLARPGDTVMLSPACASWDQFPSYAHRGTVFAEAVRRMWGEE